MAMQSVTLKLTGVLPLIIHSERLANPRDPISKKIKVIAAKGKKKTEEDNETLAWLEFQGSFYKEHFDGIGPNVPSKNVLATIRDGAKMSKLGKDVTKAMIAPEPACALTYDGPRTIQELWDTGDRPEGFVDLRSVKIGRSRVMRCRPIFREWSLVAKFDLDLAIMDEDVLMEVAEKAGKYVGLGDYRPVYGRFKVERILESSKVR